MTDINLNYPDTYTEELVGAIKNLAFSFGLLLDAGVDPDSPLFDLLIAEVLVTFATEETEDGHPEEETFPEEAAEDEKADPRIPFGWVIRDRWDNRELVNFEGMLYESEEAAIASIDQAYARPDYNEFNVFALYA